jgi:thiosulfate/3-mercaptopyruvate sulfurtransferase
MAMAVTDFNANICDASFVQDKVGDKNWVILDGRDGNAYKQGHIPGAVNYGETVVTILKHPVDGRIVNKEQASKLFGQIGLDNQKGLIIYGTRADYHVAVENAAKYYGVEKSCYMDGGYETWVDLGGEVETKINTPREVIFKAEIVHPELYVNTQQVKDIVINRVKDVTIIDVRSADEYNGLENTLVRGGHIPGAIHIPHDIGLDKDDGTMLPIEKLKDIYKNIPKSDKVIIYCHRGCRTIYTYIALKLLGYKDVSIYEESMIVWGARADTPIEDEHDINLRAYNKKFKYLLEEVSKLKEAIKNGASGNIEVEKDSTQLEGC